MVGSIEVLNQHSNPARIHVTIPMTSFSPPQKNPRESLKLQSRESRRIPKRKEMITIRMDLCPVCGSDAGSELADGKSAGRSCQHSNFFQLFDNGNRIESKAPITLIRTNPLPNPPLSPSLPPSMPLPPFRSLLLRKF